MPFWSGGWTQISQRVNWHWDITPGVCILVVSTGRSAIISWSTTTVPAPRPCPALWTAESEFSSE